VGVLVFASYPVFDPEYLAGREIAH